MQRSTSQIFSILTLTASISLCLAFGAEIPFAYAADPSSLKTVTIEDLLPAAKGWHLKSDETVQADSHLWKLEKFSDGSEIYSYQPDKKDAGFEQKRVVIRDGTHLSSVSGYRFSAKTEKNADSKFGHEESSAATFLKGRLYALTRCDDRGTTLGRDCYTATPKTCEFARKPSGEVSKTLADELKVLEVRAIATILTLRGADHQLQNVARFGNRLGLKNPLQTTKGKLSTKDQPTREKALARLQTICSEAGFVSSAQSAQVN